MDSTGWRLPARALEEAVTRLVADHLTAADRHAVLAEPDASPASPLAATAVKLAGAVAEPPYERLRSLVAAGTLSAGRLVVHLDPAALARKLGVATDALHPALLTVDAPLRQRRRGVETKLVARQAVPAPTPDPALVRALARAHAWLAALRAGTPMAALARRENCAESTLRTRLPLAFLSPRIQAALLAGTQPPELTLERIVGPGVPLDWAEQERRFGFAG